MKKIGKKLTLNRDTLRSLTTPALGQAIGAANTFQISCACTDTCLTCTCPTRCGQWYCIAV